MDLDSTVLETSSKVQCETGTNTWSDPVSGEKVGPMCVTKSLRHAADLPGYPCQESYGMRKGCGWVKGEQNLYLREPYI